MKWILLNLFISHTKKLRLISNASEKRKILINRGREIHTEKKGGNKISGMLRKLELVLNTHDLYLQVRMNWMTKWFSIFFFGNSMWFVAFSYHKYISLFICKGTVHLKSPVSIGMNYYARETLKSKLFAPYLLHQKRRRKKHKITATTIYIPTLYVVGVVCKSNCFFFLTRLTQEWAKSKMNNFSH